jgi:hypothetical protein
VHVRVPAVVTLGGHVDESSQPEHELLLTRLDPDDLPQGLILEPASDVDDDIAPRKPSLAPSIDVGIGGVAELHVAADVDVPRGQIREDVRVVPVRLEGDPLRRAEMDPARDRFPGPIIDDGGANPVAPRIGQFDAESRAGLEPLAGVQVRVAE